MGIDLGVLMAAKEVVALRFGIGIGGPFPVSASRYRHLGSQSYCVFGEVCSCSLKVVIWSDLGVLMAAKEVGALRFGIGMAGPFPVSASRYRHLVSQSPCVFGVFCSCSLKAVIWSDLGVLMAAKAVSYSHFRSH